jgi:tetratricopeptide (TPR) repeat protein
MAVTSHRKLSRKALKQPDEFLTTVDWLADFASRNVARVAAGAAAAVVAIAAIFLLSLYSKHQQRVASEQFYRALTALSSKDYKTAEEGFSALARNDPSRSLGHLAGFYLTVTYLAQNQPTKARATTQAYLAEGGGSLFRQMALIKLGVIDEDLADYRAAQAAYAEASRLTGPEKNQAEIGVARTLALNGDRRSAIVAYQQFLRDNPFAQQRTEVAEALARLGSAPEGPARNAGSPSIERVPPATTRN